MKNMTATPSKRSTLERQLDYYILVMFTLLACLCIVDAVGAAFWVDTVTPPSGFQTVLMQYTLLRDDT